MSLLEHTESKHNIYECVVTAQNASNNYSKVIREYGSTFYVGMARKKNGRPYISIASDELKSLLK